jgi:hypothetical protein
MIENGKECSPEESVTAADVNHPAQVLGGKICSFLWKSFPIMKSAYRACSRADQNIPYVIQ